MSELPVGTRVLTKTNDKWNGHTGIIDSRRSGRDRWVIMDTVLVGDIPRGAWFRSNELVPIMPNNYGEKDD